MIYFTILLFLLFLSEILFSHAKFDLFNDEKIKMMVSLNLVAYPHIDTVWYNKPAIDIIYNSNRNIHGNKANQKAYEDLTYKEAFDNIDLYANNQKYKLNKHTLSDVVENYSYTNSTSYVNKVGQTWLEYITEDEYILVLKGLDPDAEFSQSTILDVEWMMETVDETSYNQYKDLEKYLNITLNINEPTNSDTYTNPTYLKGITNIKSFYTNTTSLYTDYIQKYLPNITLSDWEKYGYFNVIKKITDDIAEKYQDKQIYITGYSEGGYYSQLAAGYLASKYKIYADVITFGSIGTKCMGKYDELEINTEVFKNINILNIKDPYDFYVGIDQTYGKSCYYGLTYRPLTAKYCASITGKNGYQTQLIKSIKDDFYRCKYLTHNIFQIYDAIYDQGEFSSEQKIDCSYRDESYVCQNTKYLPSEILLMAGAIISILLVVGSIIIIIKIRKIRNNKKIVSAVK